jgi:hypothetical protein
MKTTLPTEPRASAPTAESKETPGKGKTRLLPAGTIERALQGRAKADQRDTQGKSEGREERNA